MTPFQKLQEAIQKTEILRTPSLALATFGQTQIEYYLVSELVTLPDRSRLRTGDLVAEKPQIIAPEHMLKQFDGFGPEGKKFGEWLLKNYGQELKGLHYKFSHHPQSNRVEHLTSLELTQRILRNLEEDDRKRVTVLKGPEEGWQLSLLKSIIEISSRSFRGNLQELNERGFFDPAARSAYKCRSEIEELFKKAVHDRSVLEILARKLKEYQLFEQYQDRFFSLAKEK